MVKNILLQEIIENINQLVDLVFEEKTYGLLSEADVEPSLTQNTDSDTVESDAAMADIGGSSASPPSSSAPSSSSSSSSFPGSSGPDVDAGITGDIDGAPATGGGDSGGMSDFSGGFGGGGGGGGGDLGDSSGADGDGSASDGQENFSTVNPFDGVTSADDKLKIIMSTAEDIAKQTQDPQIVLKHIKGLIQSGFSDPSQANMIIADLFNSEHPVLKQVSRRLALFVSGT